jgi:hypothetical protein
MSVYSRIFTATSRRLTSSVSTGYRPQVLWAVPGFIGATWFIWAALSDDIQASVGLYYDPDALLNKVEAERTLRLEAKELALNGPKASGDEEEQGEEDEEEEAVTHEDIAAAVSKAVELSGGEDDDDDEDDDDAAPATAPGPAEEEEVEEEVEVVEEEEDKEEVEEEEEVVDEEEEEEEEAPKVKKVKMADLTLEEKYDLFAERATTPGEVRQVDFGFGAVCDNLKTTVYI